LPYLKLHVGFTSLVIVKYFLFYNVLFRHYTLHVVHISAVIPCFTTLLSKPYVSECTTNSSEFRYLCLNAIQLYTLLSHRVKQMLQITVSLQYLAREYLTMNACLVVPMHT
jgi:hypothetical protein